MFGTCFVTILILLCITGMFYIVKIETDKYNFSDFHNKILRFLLCLNTIGFLYVIYVIWMAYLFPETEVHQIGLQTIKLFK